MATMGQNRHTTTQQAPPSRAEIIITDHLGTDLSVLPWNYFYGHGVVLVPAPTTECMAMVKTSFIWALTA